MHGRPIGKSSKRIRGLIVYETPSGRVEYIGKVAGRVAGRSYILPAKQKARISKALKDRGLQIESAQIRRDGKGPLIYIKCSPSIRKPLGRGVVLRSASERKGGNKGKVVKVVLKSEGQIRIEVDPDATTGASLVPKGTIRQYDSVKVEIDPDATKGAEQIEKGTKPDELNND